MPRFIPSKQSMDRIGAHQRRWYLRWHLYLGLFAGGIMAIVGLTGTILTFREEIDIWLNPDLFKVEIQEQILPVEALIESISTAFPDQQVSGLFVQNVTRLDISYQARIVGDTHQIFVDPYTGKVLGTRLYSRSFI
ncbi:MAG: PepSY-associated TM helix domain-containing protein, partial [Bacteroidota bacterium]